MKDQTIVCYKGSSSYLGGEIKDGKLHLESDVYGVNSGEGGEKHYSFSKEETQKLFSIISIEDFKALCKKKRVGGMDEFLEENGITYESFCW